MCLAKVYTGDSERDLHGEPLMSEVARIECQEGAVEITDLMGRTKFVKGEIQFIDFLGSVVGLRVTGLEDNG